MSGAREKKECRCPLTVHRHGTPDDTGWGFKTMPGVFHRFPEGWHVVSGIGERVPDLPATVLWEPEEGE